MKIELSRGQIADIRYALALAAVDAINNDCPLSAKIFEEIRKDIVKQSECVYTDTDSVKAELNSQYGMGVFCND